MKSAQRLATTGTLRFERLLPGPAERVWGYLTSTSLLATWLAEGEIELRLGGYVEFRFGPRESQQVIGVGAVITGVVTHCQPPESLAFYCTDSSVISNVIFEIEPRGNDVLLLLTQAGLPPSYMSICRSGWNARLDVLADQLRSSSRIMRAAFSEGVTSHCETQVG